MSDDDDENKAKRRAKRAKKKAKKAEKAEKRARKQLKKKPGRKQINVMRETQDAGVVAANKHKEFDEASQNGR